MLNNKRSYVSKDHSESVSSDSLGELKILGHDGDSLGMDGTKVGVFEKRNQVSFSRLLEGQNSLTLESDFLFPFLSDLSDHSLEGKLSDQQVGLNKNKERKRKQPQFITNSG